MKQTICRKLRLFKQNTILLSHTKKIVPIYLLIYLFYIKNFIKYLRVIYTKSLVLVKIFVFTYNPQITKARIINLYKSKITLNRGLSMLVGISEAICLLFFKVCNFKLINNYRLITNTTNNVSSLDNDKNKRFNQWLAGLIDGDGCFLLSKKGYASLEIVMETRDKHCLYLIKQKFGGSIKLRSGINWLRYRLHHKKGLLDLINAVNGEIRNPNRLIQLNKICEKYNILLIQPSLLNYYNGWFSGIFDSDGSIYLNIKSSQLLISVSQKNRYILNDLENLYGGTIYVEKTSFKWLIYKKAEIINVLNYFNVCPSRSAKLNRIKAINRYLELRKFKAHLATDNTILGKAWKKFILRWNNWEKNEK